MNLTYVPPFQGTQKLLAVEMRSTVELRMERDNVVATVANAEKFKADLGKCQEELDKAKYELKDKGKERLEAG